MNVAGFFNQLEAWKEAQPQLPDITTIPELPSSFHMESRTYMRCGAQCQVSAQGSDTSLGEVMGMERGVDDRRKTRAAQRKVDADGHRSA